MIERRYNSKKVLTAYKEALKVKNTLPKKQQDDLWAFQDVAGFLTSGIYEEITLDEAVYQVLKPWL